MGLPLLLLACLLGAPPGAVGAEPPAEPPQAPTAEAPAGPSEAPTAEAPGMGEAQGLVPPGLEPHESRSFSLLGAPALERGDVGLLATVGFPFLTAEAFYGLSERWGLELRLDSLYLVMEELALGAKWTLFQTRSGDGGVALRFDAAHAFFSYPESAEAGGTGGARWITGQRNDELATSLVVSSRYRYGVTLFFEGTLELTLDTEPVSGPPLSGAPPSFTLGLNAPLRFGAEVPLASHVNLVGVLGIDLHGRTLLQAQDSIAMPYAAVGFDVDF